MKKQFNSTTMSRQGKRQQADSTQQIGNKL